MLIQSIFTGKCPHYLHVLYILENVIAHLSIEHKMNAQEIFL